MTYDLCWCTTPVWGRTPTGRRTIRARVRGRKSNDFLLAAGGKIGEFWGGTLIHTLIYSILHASSDPPQAPLDTCDGDGGNDGDGGSAGGDGGGDGDGGGGGNGGCDGGGNGGGDGGGDGAAAMAASTAGPG